MARNKGISQYSTFASKETNYFIFEFNIDFPFIGKFIDKFLYFLVTPTELTVDSFFPFQWLSPTINAMQSFDFASIAFLILTSSNARQILNSPGCWTGFNQFSWNCLLFVGMWGFLSRPCPIYTLDCDLLLVKWFPSYNTVALDVLSRWHIYLFLIFILHSRRTFHQAIARCMAVVFLQWHRETCKWMFANKISSFVFAIGRRRRAKSNLME